MVFVDCGVNWRKPGFAATAQQAGAMFGDIKKARCQRAFCQALKRANFAN